MKTDEITVTLPMKEYERLLAKEKEAKAPRAHTVYTRVVIGPLSVSTTVMSDDTAVKELAEENKHLQERHESLKKMNIFQFLKWKYK